MHGEGNREPATVAVEQAIQAFGLQTTQDETAWLSAADYVEESGFPLQAHMMRNQDSRKDLFWEPSERGTGFNGAGAGDGVGYGGGT